MLKWITICLSIKKLLFPPLKKNNQMFDTTYTSFMVTFGFPRTVM